MAGIRRETQARLDLLLGRMALARGLVTPRQLQEALAEQALKDAARADIPEGSPSPPPPAPGVPRPLGVILVAKGYLTDRQLTALLEEQKAGALDPRTARREDLLLGRILIQRGQVSAERVNECLRLQAEALEARVGASDSSRPPAAGGSGASAPFHTGSRGDRELPPSPAGPRRTGSFPPTLAPIPRLGELLLEKGYATAEAVRQALAVQEKTVLRCPACGRRYNVRQYDSAKTYRCTTCPGVLERLAALDGVGVDETAHAAAPVTPGAHAALGERAVERGWIAREQLDEVLRSESRRPKGAPPRRLGELLVARKLLTAEQVRDLLRAQSKQLLSCPSCRRQFNVSGRRGEWTYVCPRCRRPLTEPAPSGDVSADGTFYADPPLDSAPGAARGVPAKARGGAAAARTAQALSGAGELRSVSYVPHPSGARASRKVWWIAAGCAAAAVAAAVPLVMRGPSTPPAPEIPRESVPKVAVRAPSPPPRERDAAEELDRALKDVNALDPHDYAEKVARLDALAQEAEGDTAKERIATLKRSIEEAAGAENERLLRESKEAVKAALDRGDSGGARGRIEAFKPAYDPWGLWKNRANQELSEAVARAEWPDLEREVEKALAGSRPLEVERLLARARTLAPPEAAPTLAAWERRLGEVGRPGEPKRYDARGRRIVEAQRGAAAQRLAEAREAVARAAREDRERAARIEAALQEATGRRPLRIAWSKDVVLDPVHVVGFTGDRLKLAWPSGEIESSVEGLPRDALATLFAGVLPKATAPDRFHIGKVFLRGNLYDLAASCFQGAMAADPALTEFCPDVERIRRAARVFHGDYRVNGNILDVTWMGKSEDEALDFKAEAGQCAAARGGGLRFSGAGRALATVGDIPFRDGVRAGAVPVPARGGLHLLGILFTRPNGAAVADYILLSTDTRRFLVRRSENGQATSVVPMTNYEERGGTVLRAEFNRGKITFRVADRQVWSGMEGGFTDIKVVVGAMQGDGSADATFREIQVSGAVNPEWMRKQMASYQDVLLSELARERRVRAGGVAPAPLSLTLDALADDVEPGARRDYENAQRLLERFYETADAAAYAAATQAMQRAAQRAPNLPLPRYHLGLLAEVVGDDRDAARWYEEALRCCGAFPEALGARARQLAEEGRWEAAKEMAGKALELKPDLAEGHLIAARARLQEGQRDPAQESAALAEELAPLDTKLHARARMLRNVLHGPPWSRENRYETTHYRVRSDLTSAKCRAYAEHLEAMRPVYEQALGLPPPPGSERAEVLLFNTREGYHSYVEFTAGDRQEHTLGSFMPWYGQLMCFEDPEERETLDVLYHEGFHQYMSRVLPRAPIWFEEGMAEYVGASRVERGKATASGLVQSGRLRNLQMALRYGWRPPSFPALMTQSKAEFYGVDAPLKYAQAWSVVHFLRQADAGRGRDLLEGYIRRLAAGDQAAEAFLSSFGRENVADLESRWRRYVDALKPGPDR